MIELRDQALAFTFPEVHPQAGCTVDFQRTLRIPDDGQQYPLPAGLGPFPLQHVDDYKDKLPPAWAQHGGVFLPMYQSEALWVNFSGHRNSSYPCAVKIAAGKINAVSGQPWCQELVADPQDYVVLPTQPWLDGYAVSKGLIRQFVAMPLGQGFTAEEQLTGAAAHGGLQILVYPMKREHYLALEAAWARAKAEMAARGYDDMIPPAFIRVQEKPMGFAPGGLMQQVIARDHYGSDAWDQTVGSRCFVHITNSQSYLAITGQEPPHVPLTAKDYQQHGMPWFTYYHADQAPLPGSPILGALDSLANRHLKQGQGPLPDNDSLAPQVVVGLGKQGQIREGAF